MNSGYLTWHDCWPEKSDFSIQFSGYCLLTEHPVAPETLLKPMQVHMQDTYRAAEES